MIRKSPLRLLLATGVLSCAVLASSVIPVHAATITRSLQAQLQRMQKKSSARTNVVASTVVIVAFNTATGLQQSHLDLLTLKGIVPAAQFPRLGMVSARLTAAQILDLATTAPSVRSLSANDRLYYNLHQARVLCGVDKLRADAALTAQNGGKIVDGAGDGAPITGQPNRPQFSVVVIDSGIDTASPDLQFDNTTSALGTIPTSKVIQNVQIVTDSETGGSAPLENQIQNDTVGHGSHCSGIVGGNGAYSQTVSNTNTVEKLNVSGVASGVKIVGCGSGAGLFVLSALGGFEYALDNQIKYNVRITSNSYGSNGPYDPNDSLNIAIEQAYNANITNVFAAGNDGPGVNTISNSSKSPYVICVAAGTKEGGLASFSSRGIPASERTPTGNVAGSNEFNLPAITAPGTGREFDSDGPGTADAPNPNPNAKKFTSDILSTRSKIPGAAAGTNDLPTEFPTPYAAVYTQISGTSMACPFIAGTCALLLDANPSLTPAQQKAILQKTATHTPGYLDYETGSGYVNVYAAVDSVFNPTKPYAAFNFRDPEDFNTQIVSVNLVPPPRPAGYPPNTVQNTGAAPANDEKFVLPYTTNDTIANNYDEAKTKAAAFPARNAYAFNVVPDSNGKAPTIIDVRIAFGMSDAASQGNALGLRLWAPDGTFYSAGPTLPVLDNPTRQVVVRNPVGGLWVAELRPLRGLAAVPLEPPGGVAVPDTTQGQIFRTNLTITDPNDITELSQQQTDAIRFALANRFMDTFAGGTLFMPFAKVTREDFLKLLALNTPLRQSLALSTQRFTDTDALTSRLAEAAGQRGSTLRDFDFTPGPTLPVTGASNLGPSVAVPRGQIAVAMIRALGLDREAQALKTVTPQGTYNGQTYTVADVQPFDPAEPGSNTQNGYIQLAINRGLILLVPQVQQDQSIKLLAFPNKPLSRADMAIVINNYRRIFSAGNALDASETPTGNPPPNP